MIDTFSNEPEFFSPTIVQGPPIVTPEDVAKAIARVIAEKMIRDDGGFKSVDRDELAQETADQMWPGLLEEAKAAMARCGLG